MTNLLLFIGTEKNYESTVCSQESLRSTVSTLARRLNIDRERRRELIATLFNGDIAAGISIREPDLTVHCSYSNSFVEAALKRVGRKPK